MYLLHVYCSLLKYVEVTNLATNHCQTSRFRLFGSVDRIWSTYSLLSRVLSVYHTFQNTIRHLTAQEHKRKAPVLPWLHTAIISFLA